MKVEEYDSSRERKILTAMIVNTTVLGRISSKWQPNLFQSKWSNVIGGWCVNYFKRYQKAPLKSIEGLYRDWADKTRDESTKEYVEAYLTSLSGEYKQLNQDMNVDHVIDTAGEHFAFVKASRLSDSIRGALDSGDLPKAESLITEHSRVELGVGAGVDTFTDEQAVRSTYAEEHYQPLMRYRGALGRFFSDSLERNGFLSFCAAQKIGKSYWLLDVAMRGVEARKRVAYFQVGDLADNQFKNRFYIRVSQRPFRSNGPNGRWPCEIKWPLKIDKPVTPTTSDGGEAKIVIPEVTWETKRFNEPLTGEIAWRSCQEFMRNTVKSKNSYIRHAWYSGATISVLGIKSVLESWEQNGWTADIVIIDYADLLAPVDPRQETRDSVNTTWRSLRELSLSRHCLVVTATQTNAAGFKKRWLDRTNFSEDNRKLSHVTGMIGINSTGREKERGVCRLNWIARREGDFSSYTGPSVAGCLALANPAVVSVW